jgi:hypothetical protein
MAQEYSSRGVMDSALANGSMAGRKREGMIDGDGGEGKVRCKHSFLSLSGVDPWSLALVNLGIAVLSDAVSPWWNCSW